MKQEELNKILELHKKWLRNEEGGERANLSFADLSFADLSSANLSSANLSFADLSFADLSFADLSFADLSSANLRYAIGNMTQVRSMQIEKYKISWTEEKLNIGCESHTHDEWFEFDDDRIKKMDSGALEWWAKWKEFIKTAIELSSSEHK